jgi:tetratricopeptide (TPR) repeat protein
VANLVPFHLGRLDSKDPEVWRNLGLAIIGTLENGPPEEVARAIAGKGLPLLEGALKREQRDGAVWEAKGTALWCLGRNQEALAAYERALAEKPDWETTLHLAGKLALLLGRRKAGREYLQRAIRVNPWRWNYFHLLGTDSFRHRDWAGASRDLRHSLRLEPFRSTSRQALLIECYLRLGRMEKARAEYRKLLQLCPDDRREELRRRFQDRLR